MTEAAVDAFRIERDELLATLRTLDHDEWQAASGCEGWRVQDVVTHLASSVELVVDPANAYVPTDMSDMEGAQEVPVRARAGWSPAEALARFEDLSGQAVAAFTALQGPDLRDNEIPMGNLGTHPMHLLADAFAFDLWCHRREDLLAPRGPLDRPAPPNDATRMTPVVGWLLAGLPQMCTATLRPALTRPLGLVLTGPGGGAFTLLPTDGEHACVVCEGAEPEVPATVTSDSADFVAWSTTRRPWREHVTVEGDAGYAAAVLDAINLI